MKNPTAPHDLIQRIEQGMAAAWKSPGGMVVDANECTECADHWHIMICPAVREIMGGKHDGTQQYARFVVNINKIMRIFDKRPRVYFDTAQGESVPHIVAVGTINGHKCDLSVMCCPPCNMTPVERAYVEGPKKGTVEFLDHEE